jgi:hypothetical protein
MFRNALEPIFLSRPEYVVLCDPPNTCIVSLAAVYVLFTGEITEQFADVLRSHLYGYNANNDISGEIAHSIVRFMRLTSIHSMPARSAAAGSTHNLHPAVYPMATMVEEPTETQSLPDDEAATDRRRDDEAAAHAQKAVFEILTLFVENAGEDVQDMEDSTEQLLSRIRETRGTVENVLRELKAKKLTILGRQHRCQQLKRQFAELNEAEPTALLETLKYVKYARTLDWLHTSLQTFEHNVSDEEEFTAIQLDRQRNNIQMATLMLTAVSITFSFMSMVSGMLGENLGVGTVFLVGTARVYAITNSIAVLCSICIFACTVAYCRKVCQ